ncbi:MAG: GNAT family N-acetyltransferase [Sedimentisphaerales bacterium]|nr:GNAT family N-acetyltransferase [Sedimentisphaerales bacterium]
MTLSKNKDLRTKEYDANKIKDIFIRRAGHEDIDSLVEICKKNFRDTIVWQVPRYFQKKRWEHILSSDAAETWLYMASGKTAGLVTLIFNTAVYKQKMRNINGGILKKLCFSLMCPRLFFLKVFKKIHSIAFKNGRKSSVTLNEPHPEKYTWIEPLAVLPDMHRKGIATKLLEHCKTRTLQLKMSGIKLLVKPVNTKAINLYEKLGFKCTGHYTYTDIYTLTLREETTDKISRTT